MGTSAASGLVNIKVGNIRVSGENHVAGPVGDAIIGVGGSIVQELIDFVVGAAGCGSLFGANVVESMEEFVVNGTGIVEQGANDALDSIDASVGQRRAGVFVWCELCVGA